MKRAISLFIVSLSNLLAVSLSNLIFFCGAACFADSPAVCLAGQISSKELINNAKEYDGKSVVYVGEAVGDVMNKELAGEIQFTGSYHAKGDRLEITGVFQRNCIQHGGDMDIHAQSIRKISPGRVVGEELDTSKRNFIFLLLVVLCLVFVFVRRRKT
jgi:hypothetical protein